MEKLNDIFASRRWPVIILFLISMLAYSNTLYNGFFYDDFHVVIENIWIRDFKFLPKVFTTHLWGFREESASFYYRPILHVIFMIDYHLFGLSPWGYHLVNIIVHALNTVVVFLIAVFLLSSFESDKASLGKAGLNKAGLNKASLVAFGSALIFAVHPAHVEPVAWISAMTELSFALFLLLSLYLYMISSGGRRLFYLFSLAAFFVSLLCKETALTFPAVLILFDLCFLSKKLRIKRYVPYVVLIVCYFLIRLAVAGSVVPEGKMDEMGLFQMAINIFPLLSDYILFFAFPFELNIFRVFHPIASLTDARFIISMLVIWPILALLYFKRREGLIVFTLLWAFFSLMPALYIPGVGGGGSVFAERYLYLPIAPLALVVVYLFSFSLKGFKPQSALIFFVAVVLLVCGVASIKTFTRNRVWKSEYTLWKDSAQKTLDSDLVYVNLGSAADELGLREEARRAYLVALKINPAQAEAHNNLGAFYFEEKEYELALRNYALALKETTMPGPRALINENMGNVYYSMNRFGEAATSYAEAVRIMGAGGKDAGLLNKLGIALARSGQTREARESFQRALDLNPSHKGAKENLLRIEGLRK